MLSSPCHPSMVAALLAAAVGFTAVAGCSASATPQGPISIREQLNVGYTHQQVTYPFRANAGDCVPDSIQVTGPKGPVPAQLIEVERWPDGKSVKSGKLVFIVDELKPLTTGTYTLAYGKSPAAKVSSDLRVDAKKDQVEITTSQGIGVRLPLGVEFQLNPNGMALKAPGPILAVRLANGAWAGGSKLENGIYVAKWTSEVLESGPAVARVRTKYELKDGNNITFITSVFAGDNTARLDMMVEKDQPDLAIDFTLPPVPGVKESISHDGYGQWMRADRKAALTPGDKPFTLLCPDSSIVNGFTDCSWSVKLAAANGPELCISTRNPGGWVEPKPLTFGGFKSWQLEMIPKSWDNWKLKGLPLTYAADGTVAYRVTFAKGARHWSIGSGAHRIGDRLDWIKGLVLDWPADAKRPSPRVFVSKEDILDAWKRAESDPALKAMIGSGADAGGLARMLMLPADQRKPAEVEAALKPLRDFLVLQGDYDVMRSAIRTITMYDTVVDSGMLSPQDRAWFRAQAALLGYQMAEPQTWDMERGYHSGNPNMSVSYTLSLGIIACALSDHPMAKTWAERATKWMDHWLTHEVGPNGEWIPEGSHYTMVSYEPMLVYALAAKRAGFADFTNDARLKKMMAYHAKSLTPRDPQRRDRRVTGAWGRGTSGDNMAMEGLAAKIVAQSDPTLSKHLQWAWAESGYTMNVGDGRLGGLEGFVLDRRLPAEQPQWGTDLFPNLGVFFRAAYGKPHESYLLSLSHTDSLRNLDIWTPEVGGISHWFARGKPMSTTFNNHVGYAERHDLLRDGVRLARNWGEANDPKYPFGYYTTTDPQAASLMPSADYVRSRIAITKVDDREWFPATAPLAFPKVTPAKEAKLDWTRQVLFLREADAAAQANAAAPAYIVIRDTTKGGQPTQWQFRTLSEKVGTPDQIKDVTAFLADKPGPKLMPARELPGGARYTAIGQFDMDVEYFVASPANTPRHTLRYGGPDNSRVPEFQDFLLLQQPGDGSYYVVLFPRPRAEAAPTFAALVDGKLIKVSGGFGTDYAFLSVDEATASAEGVSVKGTSASVQQRGAMVTLSLGAAGEVKFNAVGLTAPSAASLQAGADKMTLTLPADFAGGEVMVAAAGTWQASGATAKPINGGISLTLSKGAGVVSLTKK